MLKRLHLPQKPKGILSLKNPFVFRSQSVLKTPYESSLCAQEACVAPESGCSHKTFGDIFIFISENENMSKVFLQGLSLVRQVTHLWAKSSSQNISWLLILYRHYYCISKMHQLRNHKQCDTCLNCVTLCLCTCNQLITQTVSVDFEGC